MAENRKSEMIHYPVIKFLILFSILTAGGEQTVSAGAAEEPAGSSFNVGYRVLDFKYQEGGREKTLVVAVWYPTAAEPAPYQYGGPTTGNVAVDAAPLAGEGPFPLLVFSHGYGGGGISSVFLTEPLAARGWVVAAPDHLDNYPAVRTRTGHVADFNRRGFWRYAKEIGASGPGDRTKYLYRPDEMQAVINKMAANKVFGDLVDKDRIAVGGHSFGGYTALGLCGTIRERHDPRIKAVLLFSTGAGGYLYRKDELAAVKMPSMLFMGERERTQLRGSKTMAEISDKIYTNLHPPKYFLEIRGANHFSFNNRFADNHRTGWLSGTDEQFEVICRYAIAFLEKHVAGNKTAGLVLEQSDPMLTRYLRAPSGPETAGTVQSAGRPMELEEGGNR